MIDVIEMEVDKQEHKVEGEVTWEVTKGIRHMDGDSHWEVVFSVGVYRGRVRGQAFWS